MLAYNKSVGCIKTAKNQKISLLQSKKHNNNTTLQESELLEL